MYNYICYDDLSVIYTVIFDIYPSIYLLYHLSINPSISIGPSIYQSICLYRSIYLLVYISIPGGAMLKDPSASAGDIRGEGSIPELGGCPGEGNGSPV